MVGADQFDRIRYKFPRVGKHAKAITTFLGLDSEAYTTGEPFMICDSQSHVYDPKSMPGKLFLNRTKDLHYGVYNLKYDSGAILYHMPEDNKRELSLKTKTRWGDFAVSYIPHKYLAFRTDGVKVCIWDIAQYYKSSLDNAAQTYLGESKLDISTKKFTRPYVKQHWEEIADYCIRDATLTARLMEYLIEKLSEFGIRTTALYSAASLSFRYFCDRAPFVSSWRFWTLHREVLEFACDAYQGGKFEVTSRGSFTGYEYDITSAYPYEISNLVDIRFCKVEHSREVIPEASYGFLRIRVENPDGLHVPCGPMRGKVRVYPAGGYFQTVTLAEYQYLCEIGLDIEVFDAWWLIPPAKSRPYRRVVAELFDLKAQYKGVDKMLYSVSKLMLNSWYGKTVQMIEQWDGHIDAGTSWNPIYGAVITANTRIKMTRLQQSLGDGCLAVHTDSVLTTQPLGPEYLGGGIGGLEYVTDGPGVIVGCGQYEVGKAHAFKGFEPRQGETWRSLLEENKGRSVLKYPQLRVMSWVHALSTNKPEKINYFDEYDKEIDLNADVKRIWPGKVKSRDLLHGLQRSIPMVVVECEKPNGW